jgi:dipeptidyl aminopeptidase/acylaminoacyl peptidase
LLSAFFTSLDGLQVVPPDQTKEIYKAIKDKDLPVALVEYEGEPHGFCKV